MHTKTLFNVIIILCHLTGLAQIGGDDRGSLLLNGVDQYLETPTIENSTGDFTVTLWIKPANQTSTSVQTIVSKAGDDSRWAINLLANNQLEVVMNSSTLAASFRSNGYLSNEVWRHIALVHNSGETTLYIDGIPIGQNITTGFNDTRGKLTIGALDNTTQPEQFFKGGIDELLFYTDALSVNQLRYFMNQEVIQEDSKAIGVIVAPVSMMDLPEWNSLQAYYNFNENYPEPAIIDHSSNTYDIDTRLFNYSKEAQQAPLPYQSINHGDWNNQDNWNNGSANFLPSSNRVINGKNITVNWNIVSINHDIEVSNNVSLTSLSQQGYSLTLNNDSALEIYNYLLINGSINLRGESQLIQPQGSLLDPGSAGVIKRSQQGSGNTYTYNYWSSPVSNTGLGVVNGGFQLQQVKRDGTNPTQDRPLNFTGPDISNGAPARDNQSATVSSKWIYTYANEPSGIYSNWQFVGQEGFLLLGQGYSMKGTGSSSDQNYTFVGMPNNGPINLPANAGNDYLIGNPYPSAMSADQFIKDNPALEGTLYYWEHQPGNSHDVNDYDGAYAMYNLSGGVPNATLGSGSALINGNGSIAKIPGPFIPVAQGFFVIVKDDGNITFNNSQRVFKKENESNGVFMSAPSRSFNAAQAQYEQQEDTRTKLRIGFDSPGLVHRQLLLTIDPGASQGYDLGYDGIQFDSQNDDMAFDLQGSRLSIQGIPAISENTELPLHVRLTNFGTIKIGLDHIENLDSNQAVYLKDAIAETVHNLRESTYESPFLFRGEYRSRFSLIFKNPETLSNQRLDGAVGIDIFTPTDGTIVINKTDSEVVISEYILFNMLGQRVTTGPIDSNGLKTVIQADQMARGAYVLQMKGPHNSYSRKVILQ